MIKNQDCTYLHYTAWDATNNIPKTGDSANHTIYWVIDGSKNAAANSPSELDSANCPGVYYIGADASETNGNAVTLCGKSTTANVFIIPVHYTTERGTMATAADITAADYTKVFDVSALEISSVHTDVSTVYTQCISCGADISTNYTQCISIGSDISTNYVQCNSIYNELTDVQDVISADITAADYTKVFDVSALEFSGAVSDLTAMYAALATDITGIGAQAGAGAITHTHTLTDSGTGLPIADANIWATTDAAGSNVVASGTTDTNGQVTFYLDAATYYIWRQKDGYNFTNPDTDVVA